MRENLNYILTLAALVLAVGFVGVYEQFVRNTERRLPRSFNVINTMLQRLAAATVVALLGGLIAYQDGHTWFAVTALVFFCGWELFQALKEHYHGWNARRTAAA